MPDKPAFQLWVFGDCHVGTDLRCGRESLADALRTSEQGGREGGPSFEWDVAIDVGDMSGGQAVPEDDEGREIVRQFGALRQHPREAIYSVCGNHDRSGLDEPPAWWWQKWIDPLGEHTAYSGVDPARRPYPVRGTWERYSFQVGNVLFLMMSDVNEPTQSVGRGDLGGNPGGVVSGETFRWWVERVQSHPNSIVVSVHHYVLKDTTVASGAWEGVRRNADGTWRSHYHGYKPLGTPQGASYLYWVDSVPDAGAFERYLAPHPGAVDLWLAGHTHTHPDDTYGGKSHVETRWGTHFVNAACISRFHGQTNVPKSRHLTFTEGSREVCVRCYMHGLPRKMQRGSRHGQNALPQGWYDRAERSLLLSRPFSWQSA